MMTSCSWFRFSTNYNRCQLRITTPSPSYFTIYERFQLYYFYFYSYFFNPITTLLYPPIIITFAYLMQWQCFYHFKSQPNCNLSYRLIKLHIRHASMKNERNISTTDSQTVFIVWIQLTELKMSDESNASSPNHIERFHNVWIKFDCIRKS